MRNLFKATAAAALAASVFVALSATPASAGAFCATYPDGQSVRSCGYMSYEACLRTISGAGGQCITNTGFGVTGGYGGYDDSYAYVPALGYGYGYGYAGPRHHRSGIYIGGSVGY